MVAAPSSPVHNRRLLSARNMRMSSVELPDDNEKSLSSASTSPCPSPVSAESGALTHSLFNPQCYTYKLRLRLTSGVCRPLFRDCLRYTMVRCTCFPFCSPLALSDVDAQNFGQ